MPEKVYTDDELLELAAAEYAAGFKPSPCVFISGDCGCVIGAACRRLGVTLRYSNEGTAIGRSEPWVEGCSTGYWGHPNEKARFYAPKDWPDYDAGYAFGRRARAVFLEPSPCSSDCDLDQ